MGIFKRKGKQEDTPMRILKRTIFAAKGVVHHKKTGNKKQKSLYERIFNKNIKKLNEMGE